MPLDINSVTQEELGRSPASLETHPKAGHYGLGDGVFNLIQKYRSENKVGVGDKDYIDVYNARKEKHGVLMNRMKKAGEIGLITSVAAGLGAVGYGALQGEDPYQVTNDFAGAVSSLKDIAYNSYQWGEHKITGQTHHLFDLPTSAAATGSKGAGEVYKQSKNLYEHLHFSNPSANAEHFTKKMAQFMTAVFGKDLFNTGSYNVPGYYGPIAAGVAALGTLYLWKHIAPFKRAGNIYYSMFPKRATTRVQAAEYAQLHELERSKQGFGEKFNVYRVKMTLDKKRKALLNLADNMAK